jgi:hypothetical protein
VCFAATNRITLKKPRSGGFFCFGRFFLAKRDRRRIFTQMKIFPLSAYESCACINPVNH